MFHSVYTRIQRCIIVTLYHRDTWLNNSYRWSFIVAIHSLTRIALFTEVDHRPHCSRSRRKSPRYSSPINCFNSFLYIEFFSHSLGMRRLSFQSLWSNLYILDHHIVNESEENDHFYGPVFIIDIILSSSSFYHFYLFEFAISSSSASY